MHGADVPVSVLFVERLPGSDLQNCFENAVAAKDTGFVDRVLRNGLQAIFRAAAAGYCAGDMRLDNLGISGRSGNVVICDLGGWSDLT